MGSILAYSIISGLILLAMYLVYKLFIARENQHGFNRGLLLVIYLVSFASFPLYSFFKEIAVKTSSNYLDLNINIPLSLDTTAKPIWGTILIWIFLFGVSAVAVNTLIIWIRIIRLVRSGEKLKKDGFTLVIIDNNKIAPFSWWNYIVISQDDYGTINSAIIAHELKHVRSWHSLDLLIAQLACIINWFNPAAWLMREELMLVHEYQADMAVITKGHNPQEYQKLLVKKAVGSRFPSLANSINHSKLKKRITMMYKSKSSARNKLKALALVPTVALALGVVSVPSIKAAVSTISNSAISLDKGSEKLPDSAQFKIVSLNNSGIETTVILNGENLGDRLSVSDFLFTNKNKRYDAKSVKTSMTDGKAIITAVFPFSDKYDDASIAFMVNGKEVKLNLEDFRTNSQTESISISPSTGIVISQGNAILSTLGNMEIYLDGKKITEEEMKSFNPETIASMSIDRQNNTINITSK